jgi:hypothetical protein
MILNDLDKEFLATVAEHLLNLKASLLQKIPIPTSPNQVNPTFILDEAEVRKNTNRKTVCRVLMDECAAYFQERGEFIVSRGKSGELIIQTRPQAV